ncbi:GntR family transcriptional regulator [Nocardiopsis terrae]
MSAPFGRELPPYARVVADIRARIAAGELGPGDRVPSTREITREWGVAMATATKALSALRGEGLVESVRGVGTVVRGASVPRSVAPRPETGRDRPRATDGGGRRRPSESALNRGTVVRTAIAVADAEGVDRLSMRRVSVELRVSTMALYRHVDNKDELLRAMVDEVYARADLPGPVPADWRGAVELSQRREWAIYRSHPWLASLATVTRPVLSPRLMEYAEWLMGLLTERGCPPNEALRVITALTAHMSGMALQAAQVPRGEHGAGVDNERSWRSREAEVMAEGRCPNMLRVTAPPELDIDGAFDFGMAHLLDGLTPVIEGRG